MDADREGVDFLLHIIGHYVRKSRCDVRSRIPSLLSQQQRVAAIQLVRVTGQEVEGLGIEAPWVKLARQQNNTAREVPILAEAQHQIAHCHEHSLHDESHI